MTKREIRELVIEVMEGRVKPSEEDVEAIVGLMRKDNKAEADKQSAANSKKASVNQPIKDAIVEALGKAENPMRCKDILAAIGMDITLNKVVSMVTQLVKEKLVVKTFEGGNSVFALPVAVEEDEE